MPFIAEFELFNLFLLSFLAATLIPLGSEWYLVSLIASGSEPWPIIIIATLGNYLGACTTYLIGYYGSQWILHKIFRISEKDLEKATGYYNRFGIWSLFFSWLPIIGDPLCAIGGIFRIRFLLFSLLVFSGKLLRYGALAAITSLGFS